MSRVRTTSLPARAAPGFSWIQRRALVLAAFAALCLVLSTEPGSAESGFVLVVHQTNRDVELDRGFVTEAFLKKRTRWTDGSVIRPVDQRRDASVRQSFSSEVLRRSVEAVRSYWQQRIFSGRDVPPPEVDSDAGVLRYIQENPGAIGYVSAVPNVQGVRAVTLK